MTLEPLLPYEAVLRDTLCTALADLPAGVRARPENVRLGTLGRISTADICGRGDRIAGVLVRFSGRLEQVGLFAMETEDAFATVQHRAWAEDPLGAYTRFGCDIVRVVTAAIDSRGEPQPGDTSLWEETAIQALLGTHAPSDTVVVSVSLQFSAPGEASRAGYVYVLAEPKPFAAVRSEMVVGAPNRGTLSGV